MTTDAQRAANARNAQRSTGPQTADGKARSSRNALKHGAFATRADAVSASILKEDPTEVRELVEAIVDQLDPAHRSSRSPHRPSPTGSWAGCASNGSTSHSSRASNPKKTTGSISPLTSSPSKTVATTVAEDWVTEIERAGRTGFDLSPMFLAGRVTSRWTAEAGGSAPDSR